MIRDLPVRHNHASHTPPMLHWRLFDFAMFGQIFDDLVHDSTTFINVSHLTAAKLDGDLDFVFVIKKLLSLIYFEINVMFSRLWPQAYFFCFRAMRGVLVRLFLFFVFVFTVIHNPTNRWTFIGSDFD
jgi:hypothetical protein